MKKGTLIPTRFTGFFFSIILLFFTQNFAECQNTISTLRPAITLDTNAVCAGSVMDVPFYSTGTFNIYNIYYAELSDSSGSFTKCDTIGVYYSSQSFTSSPGFITGFLPVKIPASCHYYVRIVSGSPAVTGAAWGPFCIQHCDIFTNRQQNVQVCAASCFKGPAGYSDSLNYSIHNYDNLANYSGNNKFEVQLLSFRTFQAFNTGGFGIVPDSVSGKLVFHMPCADSLTHKYGILPGVYYMRINATHSNFSDSSLGTVVHVTIGEPSDSIKLLPSTDTFCLGNVVTIYATPGHSVLPYNSNYSWWLGDKSGIYPITGASYDSVGIIFSDTGTYKVISQENNFGCLGDTTSKKIVIVICSGIQTIKDAEQIKIYPNPAIDEFTVLFNDNNSVKTIELFNVLGQNLVTINVDGLKSEQIPVSQFPSGIYMLRAGMKDGSSFMKKIEIEK